jgi:hypothetical protein
MAADERFEDAVAAEGYEGTVVGVGSVGSGVVGREAVVEICGVILKNPQYQHARLHPSEFHGISFKLT